MYSNRSRWACQHNVRRPASCTHDHLALPQALADFVCPVHADDLADLSGWEEHLELVGTIYVGQSFYALDPALCSIPDVSLRGFVLQFARVHLGRGGLKATVQAKCYTSAMYTGGIKSGTILKRRLKQTDVSQPPIQ